MTKAMRKITAILLSVLLCCGAVTSLPVTAFAEETDSGTTGDCTWTFDEETGTLTISGSGEMDDYDMWYYCPPWCDYEIKNINIGNAVTKIGTRAFQYCDDVTSIFIPAGIKSIGELAFLNCGSLESISVSAENNAYCSADGVLYTKDKTQLILCPAQKTEVSIEQGVQLIMNCSFYGCKNITDITIPDGVQEIYREAFAYSGLTTLHVPDNVYVAYTGAFYGTPWEENLPDGPVYVGKCLYKYNGELPASYEVKDGTVAITGYCFDDKENYFSGQSNLKEVKLPQTLRYIGEYAFKGSAITKIELPDSLEWVEEGAFCGKRDSMTLFDPQSVLEEVTFGDKIEFVGYDAFNSKWFENQPDGMVYIGQTAYKYKGSLPESVSIKDGTKYIGTYAFSLTEKGIGDDWKLKSVTIPEGVETIKYGAFANNSNLKSVCLPKSIQTIEDQAFGYTYVSLVSGNYEKIPDFTIYGYAGTAAEDYAKKNEFAFVALGNTPEPTDPTEPVPRNGTTGDCTWTLDDDGTLTVSGSGIMGNYFYRETPWGDRVTSVVIEDGVTSVGSYAFYDCKKLTSVTIPDSVTNIGNNAFEYCTGLKSVTIPDSVTYIGEQAFSDCTGLTSVTIPDGVTSIAFQTFCNCSELTSVTIPESVTSIGYEAFTGCWELTGVYIRDLAAWCSISFGDSSANPLYNANKLYLNNELVTDLVIPDSVTSIGDCAFPGCTGLTSVTIPDSVTSIGNNAFNDCTGLTSVTIPDSVTNIGEKAFGYYFDIDNYKYKKVDSFTIYGKKGSAAEAYANENGFAFIETESQTVVTGDVNGDDKVNGADAGLLNRYTSGWEGYADKIKDMDAADLNRDGKVNGADAGILNRYTSGWTGYDKYIQTVTK